MEGYESVTLVPHSDLEKSVEELQRNSSVNHGLVTEQDVEQKSKELRMLGETLTELKSKCGRDLECVSGDYCDFSSVAFHHIASLMQLLKAFPVCLSAFTLKLPSISGQLLSKCSNPAWLTLFPTLLFTTAAASLHISMFLSKPLANASTNKHCVVGIKAVLSSSSAP